MAKSPIPKRMDFISLSIEILGKPIDENLTILSCEVFKEAYKVSKAVIEFWLPFSEEDKTFALSESNDFMPGNQINIKAGYDTEVESIFEGIIVSQVIKSRPDGSPLFVITCSDKAIRLTLGRHSRLFSKQKDSDILAGLTKDRGLKTAVDDTGFPHKLLVQHHAVDWDFILMRAQANGMLVYYEDSELQVKKPATDDSCGLVLTYGMDVISFEAGTDVRFQMTTVTAQSWNDESQQLETGESMEPFMNHQGNLGGRLLAQVMGINNYEIQTSADLSKPELVAWAQAVLKLARLAAISGEITFFGNAMPKVNKTIELRGFGARFNGNALITRVTHNIREGRWETTIGFGLDPEWYHENQNVNTPLAGGLLPAIQGLQNGIVKDIEKEKDGGYRLKVAVPVMGDNVEGIWARLATFMDGASGGKIHLPEVGDEVVLGFLNDDPRNPVVLGMLS